MKYSKNKFGRNCRMTTADVEVSPGWFIHCTSCNDGTSHTTLRHKGVNRWDQYDFSYHYDPSRRGSPFWIAEDMKDLLQLHGFARTYIPREFTDLLINWHNLNCLRRPY